METAIFATLLLAKMLGRRSQVSPLWRQVFGRHRPSPSLLMLYSLYRSIASPLLIFFSLPCAMGELAVAKHNGQHFSFLFFVFFYFLFGSRHRTGEHLSFLGLFWAAAEQMPNRPAIAQAANLLLPRLFSLSLFSLFPIFIV